MKTIQFIGTEDKIENLHLALGIADNEMPQQSETRVYVVDTHKVFNKSHSELTDDEFMTLAETDGNVLTLHIFQKHYNIGEFDEPHYVIRFINLPKFD
jgi:hypothetical protein|tara:strand:- start:1344 stop:1637 length:294 start_codon:yes stop_codon:yes gene_type:complete